MWAHNIQDNELLKCEKPTAAILELNRIGTQRKLNATFCRHEFCCRCCCCCCFWNNLQPITFRLEMCDVQMQCTICEQWNNINPIRMDHIWIAVVEVIWLIYVILSSTLHFVASDFMPLFAQTQHVWELLWFRKRFTWETMNFYWPYVTFTTLTTLSTENIPA